MRIKTGIEGLDETLNGGLLENRSVLVTGGPGTGKSTLAMQFLQEGLANGEQCLYVSTEQTTAEIRDSFAPFEFDVDDENLTFTTIHATPGHTIEGGEEEVLTIETLSGDQSLGGGFSAPFTNKYILQMLERHAPCDRVVFDSISGLAAMSDNDHVFRRAILDMIRLFSDEFEATSLFTAEEFDASEAAVGSSDALQFNTHGVIRLWREKVDGDYHRFLHVKKMRGIDHDTRDFEIELRSDGIRGIRNRTLSDHFLEHEFMSTGIDGLDALCGDGLIKGGTTLLQHDGRAGVDPIITSVAAETIRDGGAIVLLPSANMTPERLGKMFVEQVGSLDELLENDQLFILDLAGNWKEYDYNVFTLPNNDSLLRPLLQASKFVLFRIMAKMFEIMNARRGDRHALAIVYSEALLQELSGAEIRKMHYWGKQGLLGPDDSVLFVQNPAVMDETLSEFFVYDAQQMLETWMHENGLQYVKLEKSLSGHLGSTQLVEYVDDPPYVRVQKPRAAESTLTRPEGHPLNAKENSEMAVVQSPASGHEGGRDGDD